MRTELALACALATAAPAFAQTSSEARLAAYDDLLQNLYRALQGSGGEALAQSLRQRFPAALIDEYVAHRRMRSEQIAAAVAGGARTVDEIVEKIYPGISDRLRRAAEETIKAHLESL